MGRDLVLQARLAMVRGSLSTVQRVLADLEQARHVGGADDATVADVNGLVEKIDWAVDALREAKGTPDCSDNVEGIARTLEDFLKERRTRASSARPRLTLHETDVDNDLGDEVAERLDDLHDIEMHLREAEADSEAHLSQAWGTYGLWSAKCMKVFKDYVDLVRGVLLRDSGLDNDLCRIADKLCQSQWKDYKWSSFTIPASEDHGDVSSLRLVRMGFPEWSVWALPLAMYEIGHLFAEINSKVQPLIEAAREQAILAETVRLARDDLTDGERDERTSRAGDEAATRCSVWIADAYATARLGPAYVWATVLLRADPASDADHYRVAIMLEMLRLIDESEPDRPGSTAFTEQRARLRDEWSAARAQVMGSSDMVESDDHMTKIVKGVRSRITVAFGPAAWETSMRITDQLNDQGVKPATIAANLDLRHLQHVLSAAWKARIQLADARFEPPADLAPERIAAAHEGFGEQQLRNAQQLADRARQVCIAMIDGESSGKPPATSASTVTGTYRESLEEVPIDKTRSLPASTG